MTLLLVLGGLVLMAFPGWLDRRYSFGPARFARVGRASMTVGFAAVVVGAGLWGAPAMLHWSDAFGIPGLCDAAVHRLPLGGLELAIAMAAITIVVGGRTATAIRRTRVSAQLARVDPCFGRHRRVGRYDVVVIPSTQIVAVGVPGDQPQIVISEGMVAELTSPQLDAVIRHEIAHHRLRHRDYLVAAAVVDQVFGWIPPIRSSAMSLRNAVEAWADLDSTGSSDARVATLRSALVRLGSRRATTANRHVIQRRIASLDSSGGSLPPERSRSLSSWVPTMATALIGGVGLVFTLQITDAVIRCQV